jgi:hypothetical protein
VKDDILAIAAASRAACNAYNDAHGHFWGGLGGMCGLASHFLFANLEDEGYSPTFIMGYATDPVFGLHCWVSLGRLHVDITATQFDRGIAPVYFFRGGDDAHPILTSKFRTKGCHYPYDWTMDTADSQKGIDKLMKLWNTSFSYRGITRKKLNQLYAHGE